MSDTKAVAAVSKHDLMTIPFEEALAIYTPNLEAALPQDISVEHFKRMVITAINTNPALRKTDRRALFNACVKCASDGLLPDGREAALVDFKGEAVYMPMVAGIRKRLRNSGSVTSAVAEVVYRNDHFRYQLGDSPSVEHRPAPLDEEPGDPVGAYAVITLKSGEKIIEVMRRSEIEASRAKSRAPNSIMWKEFWGEGARKTVLRRASKAAPQASAMLIRLLDRDEEDMPTSPRLVPPRPTPDQFAITDEREDDATDGDVPAEDGGAPYSADPFVVADGDGVLLGFGDPDEAADRLLTLLNDIGSEEEVAALRADNAALPDKLREAGRDDLAIELEQALAAEPPAEVVAVKIVRKDDNTADWGASKAALLAALEPLAAGQVKEFRVVNKGSLAALRESVRPLHDEIVAAMRAKETVQ